MKNNKKGYLTKFIKYESEKEYLDLANSIETNDKDSVLDIIYKIYLRGDLKW